MLIRLSILSILTIFASHAETPAEALEKLKASYQRSGGWDLKYDAIKGGETKAHIILTVAGNRRDSAIQFVVPNLGVLQGFENYPAPGKKSPASFMLMAGKKFRLPQFSELLKVNQRIDRDAKNLKATFYQPYITIEGGQLSVGGAIASSSPYPWLKSDEEIERFDKVSREKGSVIFESSTDLKAIFEEKSGLLLEYHLGDEEGRIVKLSTRKPLEKFDALKHGLDAPEKRDATTDEIVAGMFQSQQVLFTTGVLAHLTTLGKNEQEKALENYRVGMVDFYERISGDFPALRGPAKVVKAIESASKSSFQNTLEKHLAKGATKAELLALRAPVTEHLVHEMAPAIAKAIPNDEFLGLNPADLPEQQKSLLISVNQTHQLAIIQSVIQASTTVRFNELAREIAAAKE